MTSLGNGTVKVLEQYGIAGTAWQVFVDGDSVVINDNESWSAKYTWDGYRLKDHNGDCIPDRIEKKAEKILWENHGKSRG